MADTKDQNNKDEEIQVGKECELNNPPTNMLFWKFKSGNSNNPVINPEQTQIIEFGKSMKSFGNTALIITNVNEFLIKVFRKII